MAVVPIKDRSGNLLKLYEKDGKFIPRILRLYTFPSSLRDYMNEDDYSGNILLCSYPRSGYHWLHQVVHMLLNRTATLSNQTALDTNIELKGIRKETPKTSGQPIVHTHFTPDLVPVTLYNAKTIYMYRNPKDLMYSVFKMRSFYGYSGTFDDYAELFLNGTVQYNSWFDHTLQWEKWSREHNVLVVSYESMSEDPIQTLKRIADYLELDVEQSFLEAVIAACEIENMRDKVGVMKVGEAEFKFSPVRKGVVGGWKEHFTVSLSDHFDEIFKERMKTSKLEFKFEINS